MSDYEEREYVWIPKQLLPTWEFVKDILKLKGDDIQKEIDRLSDETTCLTTDNLDTTLLEMKLHAQKVRDQYKQCVDEELEKTNELWELCEEKVYDSRTKIKQIKSSFDEAISDIYQIEKRLNDLPLYRLRETMDLLDRFKSYTDEDKQKIKMLLDIKVQLETEGINDERI